MTKIKEIEEAVSHLPQEDLGQFRTWFEAFDAERWDEQFENDARSGKLDRLADKALSDLKEGRATEL